MGTRLPARLAVIAASIGALMSVGIGVVAAQERTVRIGFPFELSGRFVVYGAAGKRGAEMTLKAFDYKAGDMKIEPLFRDAHSDPQATISAVTELVVTTGVDYVVGPISSPIVAAAIPVIAQKRPVWLVPGSSRPKLEGEIGQEDVFFHTWAYAHHCDSSEAAALKRYLGDRAKRVAVIYSDDNYGRAHLPRVEKLYAQHVVVLNFGEKRFEGPPAAVIEHPAVIESYPGKPFDAA